VTFQSTATPIWLEAAAKLWAAGYSVSQIADKTGIPRGTMSGRVFRYRDVFPARTLAPAQKRAEPVGRTFFDGRYIEHVKRTTVSGAVVTMPRVSLIDGVREGAN